MLLWLGKGFKRHRVAFLLFVSFDLNNFALQRYFSVYFFFFCFFTCISSFGLANRYVWLMVSDYNKLHCDVMLNLLHNIRMRNMHICLPWECTCSGNSYFTGYFFFSFMIYNILFVHLLQFLSYSVAFSFCYQVHTTRPETNKCKVREKVSEWEIEKEKDKIE